MSVSLPPFPDRVTPADVAWQDGTPVANAFGDVYFSRDGGLAETTHVFLAGNDLPARFAGCAHFVIGETGFGTGLNFLVAARAFLAAAPRDAVLHFVSTEMFPLRGEDMARAHAHWPELDALSAPLRECLPPLTAGFHRRWLYGERVCLTLLYGDAGVLLPRLDARVDAWFLDGFAPARNDTLWSPSLLTEIARLSAAEATCATFTAAGAVRRALADAGFAMEKVPGFGRKRDMLRGRRGDAPRGNTSAPRTALVVGGGLAGCAAARALAMRGCHVTLLERHARLADETSGNIAGAVYPKFSLHETAQNRWYRDSYLHALARLPQLLGAPDDLAWSRGGLLQLQDEEGSDLAAIAASGRFPPDVLALLDADAATRACGLAVEGGLWFPGAAWVHPPSLCAALVAHPHIEVHPATTVQEILQGTTAGPGVQLADGNTLHADAVILANALDAARFSAAAGLPLRRVRGQVTHVRATDESRALKAVVCHDGYVTPARDGLHAVGATFGPRDADPAVRDTDHAENLARLAAAVPALYLALGDTACAIDGGRTGFRCQTPDYLPVMGALPDANGDPLPGLQVLAALGAKGIAFSLLGAELLAAQLFDEPLPVDRAVAAALEPGRFARRAARRAQRVDSRGTLRAKRGFTPE